MPPKIVVLASFNMDFVMRTKRRPAAGETLPGEFRMFLGGKGFNQAVAARRLGADVAAIGRVGDDAFGRRFLDALDAEGVDCSGVAVDAEHGTGVATIWTEPDASNSIICAQRANGAVSAADVERAAETIDSASVGLASFETPPEAVMALARRVRDAGGTMIVNPAPAMPVAPDLSALTHVLVPNEIEAETMSGLRPHTIDAAFEAAQRLCERGAGAVVLTLGERGAVLVDDALRVHVPPHSVRAVDTVGAGDAFCAALAVRLAEGAPLLEAVRFANAAGALAATRAGAEPSMPSREAVESLHETDASA